MNWETIAAIIVAALSGPFLLRIVESFWPTKEAKMSSDEVIREELWTEIKRLRETKAQLRDTLTSREHQWVQAKEAMLSDSQKKVDYHRQVYYEMQELFYRVRAELAVKNTELSLLKLKLSEADSIEEVRSLLRIMGEVESDDWAKFDNQPVTEFERRIGDKSG